MAEQLSNPERKGGKAGQSLFRAPFLRRTRLLETILLGASYIAAGSRALAAPPAQGQAQERDKTALADRAFSAFRSFTVSGSPASRDEFFKVWNANKEDDEFFSRFQQGISANPEVFRALLNAYNAHKGGYPTPEEFIPALDSCYSELRKPSSSRNKTQVIADHGAAFVAEAERMLGARAAPVRLPPEIESNAMDSFLHSFNASAPSPAATKEERVQSLIDAIDHSFSLHSRESATIVAQSLLYAYVLTDQS